MQGEQPRPLRVLLLFSDTGGGHRASAEAIRQEILQRDSHHHIVMEDVLLRHTIWPLTQSDRFYLWAVNRAPRVWKWLYSALAYRRVYTSVNRSLRPIVGPHLRSLYDRVRPDLVVSVHPALNHLPRRILRQWEVSRQRAFVPFATVITDLTAVHPSWVDPKVDLITVATEEARRRAIGLGASPEKVRVLGLPVREIFRHVPADRCDLRRRLGLNPDLPLVLIMGGGQGMGPVEVIARAVAEARPPAQLAVITGRNENLRQRLNQLSWPVPTRVLGFVEDMHYWMGAADLLITKAGPGTIAEALICGVPMLLYGYIPGQEEPNVRFVVENQVGDFVAAPAAIAHRVHTWLTTVPSPLPAMAARAQALAHPDATVNIVDALLALVGTPLGINPRFPNFGLNATFPPPAGRYPIP